MGEDRRYRLPGLSCLRWANAVLYFALRGETQPFGAADMAFVFLKTCTPADTPREMREQTEAAILKYAG